MIFFGKNDYKEINKLHEIYGKEIPEFIKEICQSKEMKRIGNVGQNCGRDYITSKIQNFKFNYTRYDHSVGVGLIVWKLTKNKKMAIAGLLHDIAAPCFSHVIDFYNNDSETQISTEEKTKQIISDSIDITKALEKYNLKKEDVWDYSMYPIADNEKPKLSADRLEYTCYTANSMGMCTCKEIKEIIDNIIIVKNEELVDEMCFKDVKIAEKYANIALKCNMFMAGGISVITNQLLADTLKIAVNLGLLKYDDFYDLQENEIIEILDNSKDETLLKYWNTFKNYDRVYESKEKLEKKYSVKVKVKVRYIDPLCMYENGIKRVTEVSEDFKKELTKYLNNCNTNYYSVDYYEVKQKVIDKNEKK